MTLAHCHFNLFSPLLVAANIYHEISNNEGVLGLSMEKTKDEFESGLKGFHGDLNLSLSVPNDSELLPYEVSNTVSDLKDVILPEKNEVKKKEVKDQNDTVKQTQSLTSFKRTVAFCRKDLRKKLKTLSCFRLN